MPQPKKRETGNVELSLVLKWADVQKAFSKEVDKIVQNTAIEGFRKGKVPRSMVEPRIDKTKIYSQAIQSLLPDAYTKEVATMKLKPIIYPQVTLVSGEEGKDWQFKATTCEAPVVTLPNDYEAQIKKLKVTDKEMALSIIVEHLHKIAAPIVPDILVSEEANHRIASLIENVTKLGLTTEKYLESRKLTAEDLKSQTSALARKDLEVELILAQIQKTLGHKIRKDTLDYLQGLI